MNRKWITLIFNLLLYFCGIALWGLILNFGNFTPFHDWGEINIPRLAFLQVAIRTNAFPLHMIGTGALRGLTDRFLSIPDVILSPDLLLLKYININAYIFIHWIICFTFGFLALLWMQFRYHLSKGFIFITFILFTFNGHIVAHAVVGHLTWGAYFLFPWMIILCMEVKNIREKWLWISAVSFLMLAIWLQGSFQQFVAGILFLLFFALFSIRNFVKIGLAILFSLLLSLCRILPPILIMGIADSNPLGGYPLIRFMLNSIIEPRISANWLPFTNYYSSLGWWEFNQYLGKAGVFLLILLGIIWVINQIRMRYISPFWIPILGFIFLSIRNNYSTLIGFLPLFSGIRVATRLLIISMITMLFIGIRNIPEFAKILPKIVKNFLEVGVWLLGGWIAFDLIQWALQWNVNSLSEVFPAQMVDTTLQVVGNHPDPVYFSTIIAGGLCSLLTFGFLVWMISRENNRLNRN